MISNSSIIKEVPMVMYEKQSKTLNCTVRTLQKLAFDYKLNRCNNSIVIKHNEASTTYSLH